MKKKLEKVLVLMLASMMVIGLISIPNIVSATDEPVEYTIYPTPQNVTYNETHTFVMSQNVNVVYDNGIDQATKDRVNEVLKIKKLNVSTSEAIVAGQTNILVGINGSTGYVDNYFTDKDASLFNKFDAYQLSIKENVIAILGKDTDAAFGGVTTLKHIFNQVKDMEIRELVIKDYAEVKNRGFIEGYYGQPWSNDDRADLMTYGGDYKLNQYIYAPKDDPKHNSNWKELYTESELSGIKKAIEAGNKSKCYYVYALHPFMSDAMRFDTEEHYQEDLALVKQKFIQLMNVGVKKFAILADDARVPTGGSASYVKLMKDLSNWLTTEQANYKGLKSDMIFCPADYYGWATSDEMQGLKSLPASVSIVQTGGAIWGTVSNNFLNSFQEKMDGLSPFMWVNWPCSDNTKDSLIMGGNERFLIPGSDPSKMTGIVLNPMQQSEANKSALFAVADYSWKIWQTQADVDKNWHDSFNYMDHGTIEDTEASIALRQLSKHMMNSNTGIPESQELAPKLTAFRSDFESGKDITVKANELIAEFTQLKSYATYYKSNPGNTRTKNQLLHWLNCWEDRMDAGINYLKTALAIQNKEDSNTIWTYFSSGQAALEKSKTNVYWYVNHYEYATIGRQHITPFIQSLDKTLSNKVVTIVDPSKQIISYITNRNDGTSSDQDKVLDNDPGSQVVYQSPNKIEVGTYIGISYTSKIKLNEVTFLTGHSGNLRDTFSQAKVQYTTDGETWQDINDQIYSGQSEITIKDLDLDVKGIRLIATAEKTNTWLGVRDIIVNPSKEAPVEKYNTTVTLDKIQYASGSGNINDNSISSYSHLKETAPQGELKDFIPVDATITLTFDETKQLGKINFVQDKGTDSITDAILEYTVNGTDWIELGTFTNKETIELNISDSKIMAKAVRVRNKTLKIKPGSDDKAGYWWKVYDFSVTEPVDQTVDTTTPISPVFIKSDRLSKYAGDLSNLLDNNENTDIEFKETDPNKDNTLVGDYIGYDLGRLAYIGEVNIVVGGARDATNKWEKYKLEYSSDNVNWKTYKEYAGVSSGKDMIHEDLKGAVGRYIRLTNMQNRNKWIIFSEFNVKESQEVPVEKYIYTNTDYALKTITLVDTTELVYGEPITLNKDQYVGVKMARIKDLTTIELALKNTPQVIVQTSMNGLNWTDVTDYSELTPARYVRLINKTENPITFNIDKMIIHSNEVVNPYLLDTTMTINGSYGGSDTRYNGAAFDNDVTTVTKFSDYPQKDQYILYDLGQMRDVKSIRMYLQDTDVDYIRDAKFYVSENKTDWTEVMTIGDGVENTGDSNTLAKDSGLYSADNTYPNKFYVESKGLNVKGRYLKIVFTASYNSRFVSFNEIMINGGEYVPLVNDPSFESNVIEKRGFAPQNMFDGDLSTAYMPNTTDSGYIIYHLSEELKMSKLNIVQKGTITNAKVYALVDSSKARSETEWVQIGSLDKSLNELYNPFYDNIYAIKIEWEANKVPQLSEIVRINDSTLLPDRTALQTYIDNLNVDSTLYTKSTYDNFANKLDLANEALNNNNSSQANLDDALSDLIVALTGLVEKGNISLVQDKVNELEALDENDYTTDSYNAMKTVIHEAKALLDGDVDEVTTVQVAVILNKLQIAQSNLVSVFPSDKEGLKQYIETNRFKDLDSSLYLTDSFKPFKMALDKALSLTADSTNPTADECIGAAKALRDTRKALVLKATKTEMQNLLSLINSYSQNKYTPSSWMVFNTLLVNAKTKVQENEMTSANVETLRNEILEAAKKLVVKGNKQSLENAIRDLESINSSKYTLETRKALLDAIDEAKELLKKGDELTQAEIDNMIQKMMLAKQGLKELSDSTVSPTTNDSTHIEIIVGMGLLALSLIVVCMKRKKED